MTVRISWDRYEVALLFDTYERVAGGSDTNSEAVKLSESLRTLATRKGISIDETYRNVNGMKMQLANVQYLFTCGQKGLSGASTAIRQMYELYRTDYTEYQMILKEAIRLTGSNASIEDAFFAYTKKRMRLSPDMIADYMQKAAAYCHLKQPLLGMADVKAVRNVQQKVAEGKLLRFQYGKDAQTIRSVAQLYYAFIKSYRAPQEESSVQKISAEEQTKAALDGASDMRITDTEGDSEHQAMITMEENNSLSPEIRKRILSSVSEYFPHGIRPASIIDINKLKRVYQSKFGEDVPADIDMVSLLMSGGLKSGEKVHFLSEDQQQSLRNLIMDIIRSGHRVIYYSELLSLHGELFEACHIYESPLMKTVLQSILPGCIYKAEWLLANQKANEIEEITEAFGADVILTYQQLKKRCPYLTMSAIKLALSRSDRFVWSSPETYAQVERNTQYPKHRAYDQITRSFITDNCACLRGRGVDYTLNRLTCHLRRYRQEHGAEGWVLKCDIHHYFQSINHEIACQAIRKRVKDTAIADRACEVVNSFGGVRGIGLGSQISQLVALAVLDDLDHFIKERFQRLPRQVREWDALLVQIQGMQERQDRHSA